jgi:ABC-2 type transport system permease protein
MVIATPSFILSGFTWPLSQMPVWVQAISNVIPLTHFLKAFRVLIIENGTFSQTTGAIWSMVIIGTICYYPILLCILKEKCFKGSLTRSKKA